MATTKEIGGFAGWVVSAMKRGTQRTERTMRVLETLSLGGRKQLALVECGGQRFLVGTGPDSVDSLVMVGSDVVEHVYEGLVQ